MTDDAPLGWRPLRTNPTEVVRAAPRAKRPVSRPGPVSRFTRLARTHAFSAMGDAAVAMALAGSLFFDISAGAARGRMALYLVFTMAPFAVVAPLLGPLIDRVQGGRRWMVIGGAAGRAVLCLLMARHLKSNLLFLESFMVLVFSKAYAVSKSALVPIVVHNDRELVEANSKLGVLSGVGGAIIAIPALVLRLLFGSGSPVMLVAAACFAYAAVLGFRLPSDKVAEQPIEASERKVLRSLGIPLAASAMAVVRGAVGFLSFHLAFWLREPGTPTWWFGVVVAASSVGAFVGNTVAPKLRDRVREETMLSGCLIGLSVVGLLAALDGSRAAAAVVSATVGISASIGRLAFDAIVQRDAADANRGRAFARFETRFQLTWVLAAFVPVIVHIPGSVGLLCVGLLGLSGIIPFYLGTRVAQRTGRARVGMFEKAGYAVQRRRAQEMGKSLPRKKMPAKPRD